jgi:hypothetical protein
MSWLWLVAVVLVLAGGAIWWLRREPPAQPVPRTDADLVAAAISGEVAALQMLGRRDLGTTPAARELRERLAAGLAPLLVRDGGSERVSLVVAAAAAQRCNGLAQPVVALVEAWPAIVDLVDDDALIQVATMLAPDAPQRRAEAEAVVTCLSRLIAGGGAGRAWSAQAVQRLTGPSWAGVPGVTTCLDQAVAALPDPGALAVARHLIVQVYGRSTWVERLGGDAERWRNALAEDHEQRDRLIEVRTWLEQHGAADRVADGAEQLEANRRFLVIAAKDLDGWLRDEAWPGPLGWTRAQAEELATQVKQAQYSNRSAAAGATAPPVVQPAKKAKKP